MKSGKVPPGPFMPIFVVHEHFARNLHFDLRLALDNVLKSWAVPKEPPLDNKIKRLAIQVDDHALDYANFEGEIPEGFYGAGKVKIWDNGKFDLIERNDKKIVVNLKGKKLKGEYILLKFPKAGEKNWLFFKK